MIFLLLNTKTYSKLLLTRKTECCEANFDGATVERIQGIYSNFKIVLGLQQQGGEHQATLRGSFPKPF